jgi:hypothetical protein
VPRFPTAQCFASNNSWSNREYFQNTREPFTVTIAGTKLCIMTSPEDASAVLKNVQNLTFDVHIKHMMIQFGSTPEAVDKMWQTPTDHHLSSSDRQPNPRPKAHVNLWENLLRQQLQPGEKLNKLLDVFLGNIDKSLAWETMTEKIAISTTENERTVSLLEWTRQVLLEGATRAFFGDKLQEIEPNLFEYFFYFDDNSWKFIYKLPRYWSKDVYAAKGKCQDALKTYFCLPQEQRPGEAWLIRTLESEFRGLGIDDSDIAASIMMIFWV